MNLLTIKKYSELKGISTQAVYKQIKAKKLKTVVQGGKTFIKCKEQTQAHQEQARKQDSINDESLSKVIKLLESQLVEKDKQISTLMLLNGNLQSTINEKETKLLEYKNRTFTQRFKDLFKSAK